MFDYQQLETLIDIEREGSFENTAYLKRVSKSAISQKSYNIDHRIGLATVARNPSNLTAFGKSLCRHIEKVQLLESRLVLKHRETFDSKSFDRAVLKIAFEDVLPSRFFLGHLEPNLERKSRFPLEMVVARHSDAIDCLHSQEVSAAISNVEIKSKYFESYCLDPVPCVAVTSPNYAQTAFATGFSAPSVLKACRAAYDRFNDLNQRFAKEMLDVDLGAPRFKLSSLYGIRNLCVDGCAWAILPAHLVRDQLRSGELVNLHPGNSLEAPLYWHVSSFLDDLIKDVTTTICETAADLASTSLAP